MKSRFIPPSLSENHEEFIERALRYLDGAADETELARLNEELAGDADRRNVFISLCRDAQLIHESQVDSGDDKVSRLRFVKAAQDLAGLGRRRIVTRPVVAIALIATLVFAASLFVIQSGGIRREIPVLVVTEAKPPVATLREVVGVRWHEKQPALQVGALLTTGVLRLEEGLIVLETERGVSITLEGPAEFEMKSAVVTRLNGGRLTAQVSKQGRGFIVESAALNLADLGTAFGVEVSGDQTRIAVFDGEVEVDKPTASGDVARRTPVREGAAVVSTVKQDTIDRVKFRDVAAGFERSRRMSAGVIEIQGDAVFQTAGAPEDPYTYTDSSKILILPERQAVPLESDLEVDLIDSGRVVIAGDGLEALVEAGEDGIHLDSFLVQFNRSQITEKRKSPAKNIRRRGGVRFGREVAGVIVDSTRLRETDDMFGAPSFSDNPDHQERRAKGIGSELRGLEKGDEIGLSKDRRTLTFTLSTGGDRDQIRVLLKR